jgi:hypothetical protein
VCVVLYNKGAKTQASEETLKKLKRAVEKRWTRGEEWKKGFAKAERYGFQWR